MGRRTWRHYYIMTDRSSYLRDNCVFVRPSWFELYKEVDYKVACESDVFRGHPMLF